MIEKYSSLEDRIKIADQVDKEWDVLALYRDIAMGAAAVLLALGGSVQLFLTNVLQDGDFTLLGEIIVKIFFVVLFFLWYYNGNEEFKFLKKWVRTPALRPQRPIIIMFMMIGLGAFFGVMTAFAPKIHVMLFMFCIYLMADIYMWILRRGEIGVAIEVALKFFNDAVPSTRIAKTRNLDHPLLAPIEGALRFLGATRPSNETDSAMEKVDDERFTADCYREAIEAIRSYYFDRRHITRIVLTLVSVFALFAVSYRFHSTITGQSITYLPLISEFRMRDSSTFDIHGYNIPIYVLRLCAYCLFISLITCSEIVLYSWRKHMRIKIYDVQARLTQHELIPIRR
jgi:hypothetical protein